MTSVTKISGGWLAIRDELESGPESMLEKIMTRIANSPSASPAQDLRELRDCFVRRSGQFSPAEIDRFGKIVPDLLARSPLIERIAFAKQVAKSHYTPRSVLVQCCEDHWLVSAPVLEHSPMLEDSDLIHVTQLHGEPVMLAIAKRENLSVFVTDLLVEGGDHKALGALIANPGARISKKSQALLQARIGDDTDLLELMSRRNDMLNRTPATKSTNPARVTPTGAEAARGKNTGTHTPGAALPPQDSPRSAKVIRYS